METPEGRKDFNERTGRVDYWNSKGRELEKLMWDMDNDIIDPQYVEHRDCPLCGTDNLEAVILWNKEGLFYMKCQCGMVYISPALKQDMLEKIYESSESMKAWLKVLNLQENLDAVKFDYLIGHINKYIHANIPDVKILDVGASYGYFCSIAMEWGWQPVGLELSEDAYKIYQRRFGDDFSILNCKIENFDADGCYDVVTLWEVLEHIPNPHELLREVHRVLVNDGILGILVPNLNSITAKILHEKAKMFGANHLNYWNKDTLTVQLDRAGFEVLETGTIIGDVNTWYNYINFEEPYTGNLMHPDNEVVTKNVIASGEGYKLFVVARKKKGGGSS